MPSLWEVLSDKGWVQYPKEVSELLDSSCSIVISVGNSPESLSFEIDVQRGTQTSSSGNIRKIRRIVWEYLDNECCRVFQYHDSVLLENALSSGVGNLWNDTKCTVLHGAFRVKLVAPDKHIQTNPKTSTELIVKRLEKHSHTEWVCETEFGEKRYSETDSELLEKIFHTSLEYQVPVRNRRNIVLLASNPVHRLEKIDISTGLATGVQYPLHRKVVLGKISWVYEESLRDHSLDSVDCAKLEELWNQRELVKLSDDSILNFSSMELKRAGASHKVFRTELPEGRMAFLSRHRVPVERALWQFWWKGGWKHMPQTSGAALDSKCQVALSGRYIVDVQLLCQLNTDTGFVRSVRRVEWTFDPKAHSYDPSDALHLEAAYLAGRASVPVCGLRCQALVNTTPMTLKDAEGSAACQLLREACAGGGAAAWRCATSSYPLSAEDRLALERAWSAFRRVPLRGGVWTVDLAAMMQTNTATGKQRPVARTVVPAGGAEAAALERARSALRQWVDAGGGGDSGGGVAGDDRLLSRYGEFVADWEALRCFDDLDAFQRVTGRPGLLSAIRDKLGRLRRAAAAEEVALEAPDGADLGPLVGGALRQGLEEVLLRVALEAGADPAAVQLTVCSASPGAGRSVVRLTVAGDAKAVLGALVSRARAGVGAACGVPPEALLLGGGGGVAAAALRANPRLLHLATPAAPAAWKTRDEAMALLAHIAVWECGAAVYGGFVRDWVVRGRSAEDVDALVPRGGTAAAVAATLCSAAKRHGLECRGERVKGAALTFTFDDHRFVPAPARTRTYTHSLLHLISLQSFQGCVDRCNRLGLFQVLIRFRFHRFKAALIRWCLSTVSAGAASKWTWWTLPIPACRTRRPASMPTLTICRWVQGAGWGSRCRQRPVAGGAALVVVMAAAASSHSSSAWRTQNAASSSSSIGSTRPPASTRRWFGGWRSSWAKASCACRLFRLLC